MGDEEAIQQPAEYVNEESALDRVVPGLHNSLPAERFRANKESLSGVSYQCLNCRDKHLQ